MSTYNILFKLNLSKYLQCSLTLMCLIIFTSAVAKAESSSNKSEEIAPYNAELCTPDNPEACGSDFSYAIDDSICDDPEKCDLDPSYISQEKQYEDVIRRLERIHKFSKAETELFEIGTSDTGDIIYGIKIGTGETHNLVVGGHHGNEYGTIELAESFAYSLAQNPIEGQTMHIIPVLNINGYNTRRRKEVVSTKKLEALSGTEMDLFIDPNRDYESPCKKNEPWQLKSTRALADYIDAQNIINLVTLHSRGALIVYPWGFSTDKEHVDVHEDHKPTFLNMARMAVTYSDYKIVNSTRFFGPTDGTLEDYGFWKHGIWSILFELGKDKYPSDKKIADIINENVPGLRLMFEHAPTERAPEHSFDKKNCNNIEEIEELDEVQEAEGLEETESAQGI